MRFLSLFVFFPAVENDGYLRAEVLALGKSWKKKRGAINTQILFMKESIGERERVDCSVLPAYYYLHGVDIYLVNALRVWIRERKQ